MKQINAMTIKKNAIAILFFVLIIPLITFEQSINPDNIKKVRLKMYPDEGLDWKGETALNSNRNKIT